MCLPFHHDAHQAEEGLEPSHFVLQTKAIAIYATQLGKSREGIEPSSFD